MKHIYLSLLAVLSLFHAATAQTPYPNGVTNCIARWDFSSSTNLPDVSGNGLNATPYFLTNATNFRSFPNTAQKFDGTKSNAIVAHNTKLNVTSVTIVSLVKFDDFYSGNCEVSQIISKGYPHQNPGNYGMGVGDNFYDGGCGTFSPNNMQQVNQFNSAPQSITPGNYVQKGKWYFMAASYDGNKVAYYQKEMTNAYSTSTLPFYTQAALGTAIGSNSQDLSIGKHLHPSFPYWLNGSMDELALFNRVLSDSEVHTIYQYLWAGVFINQPFTQTLQYPGATLNLAYTVPGSSTFTAGNIFIAQLSDAMGNFTSPVTIGTVSSITSGSITCIIPTNTPDGLGYRIRIVASNGVVSEDNGNNIVVTSMGVASAASGIQLNVSPNPNTGSFVIKGETSTRERLDITVTNVIGQTIYKADHIPVNGQVDTKIDLHGISNGMYNLQLKNSTTNYNTRIVVNK